MLKGKFIDDCVLRLKEGSDDAYLSREQVGFWLDTYRDAIVKNYLDDLISKGRGVDPYYFERENCLEIGEEDEDCVEPEDERLYVQVSKNPMSLLDDKGFLQLTTNEGSIVLRSRLENITWINDLPYAAPSCRNLVYYRDGRKLVIQGLSRKNKSTEFIATYIPSYANQELGEDQEFKIHDALIPQLMEMVEEVARREVYQPEDTANDGEDNKTGQPQ